MPRLPKFQLIFAPEATGHLAAIVRKHHRLIESSIDEQLTYTPATETRNRKPHRQPAPFGAEWELRCGPQNRFRIFYEVREVEQVVVILAIGEKDHERLYFAGEEFQP